MPYNDFIKYALGEIDFKIYADNLTRSERIISQNVDRVISLLQKRRRKITRYFSKLSSLDEEAARLLIAWHECRLSRKPTEPGKELESEAHLTTLYEQLARCANDFAVFGHDITPTNLRQVCEYNPGTTIRCDNITHGAYFFALLERFSLLDTNWRSKMTRARGITNKAGDVPSVRLLTTAVSKIGVTERMSSIDAPGPKDFYDKITKAVKDVFLFAT